MTTAEHLKAITDRAKFERIANAILRIKYPVLEDLIESGINEKGETIKDPVDAFVQISKTQYGYIEHTTNDSNLERKWLNENTSKHNPLGDLIKAATIAREKRVGNQGFEFIIFLVTNQLVSSALEAKVMEKIPEDFITVKIVELSILADFLDHNPTGQYLRKIHLGIEADLLSAPSFNEIARQNLYSYGIEIYTDESSIVETTALSNLRIAMATMPKKLGLLIAPSGGGKSTAAYSLLHHALQSGYSCLRIEPKVIAESNSILDAIERQLILECPHLFVQKDVIRQLFTGKSLIVVDDINKQDNPTILLEKIISWMQIKEQSIYDLSILCPVWPKNMALIENSSGKEKYFETLTLKKLTRRDGVHFIQQTLSNTTLTLSDPQTDSILRDTLQDPLLMRLYLDHIINEAKYVPNYGQQIIEGFVNEKINILASKACVPETKYKSGLEMLGYHILNNRILNPSYADLKKWFKEELSDLTIIETIAAQRFLFYFDKKDSIVFRHDRVRDFILVLSLQNLIGDSSNYQSILGDPYYSELIGSAISMRSLSAPEIDLLLTINPLAVYYSLKFLQPDDRSEQFNVISVQIKRWNSEIANKQVSSALINAISSSFLHFDTKDILEITKGLPESIELHLARFRNGDPASGVKFLASYTWFPPSAGNYWRDIIFDHVRLIHLEKTIKAAQFFLSNQQQEKARQNIYLLAGYLHSPELTLLLQKHWEHNVNPDDFVYYFWSILNCFNKDQVSVVTTALEYWTGLEDTKDKYGNAAGLKNEIVTEFRHSRWELSDEQIDLLIPLGEHIRYTKLIYCILEYIDSPTVLTAVIIKLAKLRKATGDKSYDSIRASEDRWDLERRHSKLSERSRAFLLAFWKNKNNPDKERYFAFRFWCGNEEGEKVVTEIRLIDQDDSELYDSSIFWRAKLRDKTVTTELISLIGRKWWGVRWSDTIWNEEFKTFFKQSVQRAIDEKNGGYLESALETLRKINQSDAEEILVEFWDTIRTFHVGFITALFIATPKTRQLAGDEINRLGFKNWDNVKDFYQGPLRGYYIFPDEPWNLSEEEKKNAKFLAEEFKYAYFNYGYFSNINNPELTLERLKSLRPYFQLMDDHGLSELAEQCQRLNYLDWVKEIYPFLSAESQRKFLPTDEDIITELTEIAGRKRPAEIDQFIKDLNQRAVDYRRFAGCISKFVTSDTTLEGTGVICKCLEIMGTREDIPIIEKHMVNNPDHKEKAGKLKANTIFKILRNNIQ